MLKPVGHRLLIQPDKVEDFDPAFKRAKEAGIEILENHVDYKRERAGIDKGTVLSLGTTAFRDFGGEAWCKEGDYIAYAKHAGKWVQDPDTDEQLLIINDEDVVCIIQHTKKDA